MVDPKPARYAILFHDAPRTPPGGRGPHYDWMFETPTDLETWATATLPQCGQTAVAADLLAPHRKHYLTYEGVVSGGRGTVRRVESGRYCLLASGASSRHFQLTPASNVRRGLQPEDAYCVLLERNAGAWSLRVSELPTR